MIVARCCAQWGWGVEDKVGFKGCLLLSAIGEGHRRVLFADGPIALSGKVTSKWQVKTTDCEIVSSD